MIKLVAALASARDHVDRSIAFGEAIPRLETLRRALLWGLAISIVILFFSYMHLSSELDSIRSHQQEANVERAKILHQLDVAQGDRWVIIKALAEKAGK